MAIIKPNNNTISAITALPAAIATGKVLQVVQDTHGTEISTSSPGGAEVDVGVSASITPSSSSNKILIIGSVQIQENKSGTTNTLYWSTRIYAGSSKIFESPNGGAETVNNNTGELGLRTTIQFLHSPNSTSQITYTLKGKNDDGGADNMVINRNGSPASITLMEIAG